MSEDEAINLLHKEFTGMPFGKLMLEVSSMNHQLSNVSLRRSLPQRFNLDNSKARGYIATKLRNYEEEHASGTITLELRYKDGDLLTVVEHRNID